MTTPTNNNSNPEEISEALCEKAGEALGHALNLRTNRENGRYMLLGDEKSAIGLARVVMRLLNEAGVSTIAGESAPEQYGELLPKDALILRVNVGTATDEEEGIVYEMTTAPGRNPLVKSNKTGKTFALSWSDIVNLAVARGINNPE